MDYGTKTLALAARIAKAGAPVVPDDIYDVNFAEQAWAPQKVAWTRDGDFLWGHDIDLALIEGRIRGDDVIECWKLLLYKGDHATSAIAQQVRSQLGQRTLEQPLASHFAAIVLAARENVKRSRSLDFSAGEIDKMQVQLFLSVPQMWTAPANLKMTQATKDAGIGLVNLVYEPQAAAAYYTHKIKGLAVGHLRVGDEILVADIGGGTGDFVSYSLTTDSEAGANVGLGLAHDPEGSLCGSEFVTERFRGWLLRQTPGLNGLCVRLGLSRLSFLKAASEKFDELKSGSALSDVKRSGHIHVDGAEGSAQDVHLIKWTSDMLETLLDPVIEKIFERIDAQRTPRTKVLIIPGGFGRSRYLLSKLEIRYGGAFTIQGQTTTAVGSYQPVSRGALLRYSDIQTRGLGRTGSFGIGQVEKFDPRHHRDAIFQPNERMHTGRVCRTGIHPRPNIVERDPFDHSVNVVYERWLPMVSAGEEEQTKTLWQQQVVLVDEDKLTAQVYWTEREDVQAHSAILTGGNITNSTTREGIEEWGDRLVRRLPDLRALGFEVKEDNDGDEVFEFYWCLKLNCKGANITVLWQIAKPGMEPYDEEGNWDAGKAGLVEFVDDGNLAIDLSEEAYNANPRTSLA